MIDYTNLTENEVTVLRDTEARKDQELIDQQEAYDEVIENYKEINEQLLEACKNMKYVLKRHGVWDKGSFYYNGKPASEFIHTIDLINKAIAKSEGK